MSSNRSRSNSVAKNRSNSPNVPRHTPNRRMRPSVQQQAAQPVNGASSVAYSPSVTPARSTKAAVRPATTSEQSMLPSDDGVSPMSRYYKNLGVLQRKDPHITSHFDQFAHVTLYYLDEEAGGKYERGGYEGAMFFFERDIEPTYGFFIMNRQGMEDYVRYLHPTDIIEPTGEIVWLGTVESQGKSRMGDEDKTAGLWSMSMDVRESLGDMMKRLHGYIKARQRYPDEFRYGPDRIAPQQTHIEVSPQSNVSRDTHVGVANGIQSRMRAEGNKTKQECQPTPSQSAMSELDQLFAKLAPAPDPPLAPPSQSLTGLALLNTMFASVSISSVPEPSPSPAPLPQPNGKLSLEQLGLAPPPAHFGTDIISPQPSAAGLPQILTADVIHGLMGLSSDSSRSTSRLSAYASGSVPQSPSSAGARRSRERGYYADRGEDDGTASEASMGTGDANGNGGGEYGHARSGGVQPFLGVTNLSSSGTLKGDATPRARPEILDRSSPSPLPAPHSTSRTRPPAVGHAVSEAHALSNGSANGEKRKPKGGLQAPAVAGRTVSAPSHIRMPFQSSEELWPDAISASNSGSVNDADSAGGDDDDVVELDFSEIRALDDIHALKVKNTARERKAEASEKQPERDRQQRERKPDVNGSSAHPQGTPPTRPAKKTRRGGKQTVSSTPSRNGSVSDASTPPIAPLASQVKEAKAKPAGPTQSLQPAVVLRAVSSDALRSALRESGLLRKEGTPLERNALIREVLTLIHTDKAFQDRLYQTYLEVIPGSS